MAIQLKYISDFPSEQAEEVQKHLKELDTQGKLLDYFKEQYTNLGAENSLANYILKNWEKDGKKLYIEWTGIETFDDKKTIKALGIKLNKVSYGSNRYFLWKCSKCQHEWAAKLTARIILNSGCPACNRNQLIVGVNDLETWCDANGEYGAKLKSEFMGKLADGTTIKINQVSRAGRDVLWWKCSNPDCGYEWTNQVSYRTSKKRGCPKCAGTQLIIGTNDLETFCKKNKEFMYLLDEFQGITEDKRTIKASEISRASHTKVKWCCKECGYIWYATPNSRTSSHSGCPKCAGNSCITGVNDLETYCKENTKYLYLLDEFVGKDENGNQIKASEIGKNHYKKIQWKCRKCHRIWSTTSICRLRGDGCPYCTPVGTSFPEQFIYQSLKQIFPSTENRWKDPIKGYEYDIVIPELKLCIEYSGVNWHADKLDRDQAKAEHCKANKVNFLQIYAHHGEITDEQDSPIEDTYEKNQIIYKISRYKAQHIPKLQYIIKFILDTYAPRHSIQEINFELAEQQANEVMGKA